MKDKNKKKRKKASKRRGNYEEKSAKKEDVLKNKEYTIISYFFVAIFISLIGYMVYLM